MYMSSVYVKCMSLCLLNCCVSDTFAALSYCLIILDLTLMPPLLILLAFHPLKTSYLQLPKVIYLMHVLFCSSFFHSWFSSSMKCVFCIFFGVLKQWNYFQINSVPVLVEKLLIWHSYVMYTIAMVHLLHLTFWLISGIYMSFKLLW